MNALSLAGNEQGGIFHVVCAHPFLIVKRVGNAARQANPASPEPKYLACAGVLQTPTRRSRVWISRVDEDKRTVREIDFQPIGGLKFFRQSNGDLKPAHGDDEFIRQFLGIHRANIDTWPVLRHFARQFVGPSGPPDDDSPN
jgi:hypothetical protein